MNSMFNPPHPGLTLRDDILPALELQVREAAVQFSIDRTTLSKVLNGRAAISPAMALRIERWLGRDHVGTAEVWLAQQAAYGLWQARQAAKATKGRHRRPKIQLLAQLGATKVKFSNSEILKSLLFDVINVVRHH